MVRYFIKHYFHALLWLLALGGGIASAQDLSQEKAENLLYTVTCHNFIQDYGVGSNAAVQNASDFWQKKYDDISASDLEAVRPIYESVKSEFDALGDLEIASFCGNLMLGEGVARLGSEIDESLSADEKLQLEAFEAKLAAIQPTLERQMEMVSSTVGLHMLINMVWLGEVVSEDDMFDVFYGFYNVWVAALIDQDQVQQSLTEAGKQNLKSLKMPEIHACMAEQLANSAAAMPVKDIKSFVEGAVGFVLFEKLKVIKSRIEGTPYHNGRPDMIENFLVDAEQGEASLSALRLLAGTCGSVMSDAAKQEGLDLLVYGPMGRNPIVIQ